MGWFGRKPDAVDRWRREPDDVAVRIESEDVKRAGSTRPFVVYDGTVALVFQQGKLLGKLVAGKHDIDGDLRRWLVGDHPTTLVIADAGDVSLDGVVGQLYSRENHALTAKLRATLELAEPEAFYANAMKDRRRYTKQDLLGHLHPELHEATLAFTSTHPIDDLYHNASLRDQLARVLHERADASLARLGLRLVALNVVGFESEHFDRLRERQASVDLDTRKVDLETLRVATLKKAREILADEKKHGAVGGARLQSAIHQAAHALKVRDKLREADYEQLTERLEQDARDFVQQREQARDKSAVEHELDVEAAKSAHAREETRLDVDGYLRNLIATAEAGEKTRDLERAGDEKDLELANKARDAALAARRRMKQDDAEIEAQRVASLSEADTSTKIALGLGDKEALLELERLEREQKMSPEQLLVKAAEKSPEAAAALAERFRAEGRMSEDLLEQLKRQLDNERQLNKEHASQLERVLNQALQQMGRVATAKSEADHAGDQTIVTGGGLGPPTIIDARRKDRDKGDDAEGSEPAS